MRAALRALARHWQEAHGNGRFKVFAELNDWFEEFSMYHRKDGKVVKERDDLLCATRYGQMMLRFARTVRQTESFNRKIIYPQLGMA